MTLREYQQVGRSFLASRQGALLADEMGLGKTAQAATALWDVMADDDSTRSLIICPASLKINWQRELEMWAPGIDSTIVYGRKSAFPAARIVIINYNLLADYHEPLRAVNWQVVVVDEAHNMQSIDSQRTIQIRGGSGKRPIPCIAKWAMTGTPLRNGRPINIYPILKWLGVSWASKFDDFGRRYGGGQMIDGTYPGSSNTAELNTKLKGIMLRRMKSDVLKDLPPKIRQIITLEIDSEGKAAIAEEQSALQNNPSFDKSVDKLIHGRLDAESKGELARLRKKTALAKVPACARYIEDLLTCTGKLIIYAYHHDVIDKLCESLDEGHTFVKFTGQRQEYVDAFQNDPDLSLFVANFTCVPGLTLTAASVSVFIEESWVPSDITQAEDRNHRIGQRDACLVQHLILEGSIDATMVRSQVRKQNIIDEVLS